MQEYNVVVRSFPTNLTAMMFSFKEKPQFTVENEKEICKAPKVDFGTRRIQVCDSRTRPLRPSNVMKTGMLARAWLAAALLFVSYSATAQVPVPPLKARVTDLTSTLSADQARALEQKLAALEARKGSQVAVLLVPTTQPEAIEQYSIRVVEQWKLGRKGVDDGVLLLVAKNDRKLRIEVGRGLEGAIPDAYARRIVDEEISPRFKQGDFYGGISAGVDRIAGLVEGEAMPPPAQMRGGRSSDGMGDIFLYGIFAVLMGANLLQSLLGRLLGSVAVGLVAGAIIYFLASLGVAMVAGIIAFLISLFMGTGIRSGGWSSGGGFSGGGGGFSGGGFSGGGGGFSGGGSSGSW